MDELYLIYINHIGETYLGKNIYEFIFSDKKKDVDGDDWDKFPASGRPGPPFEKYIKKVGRVECDLTLDLIQNSDTFAVWDSVDGIIALGWENMDGYQEYPENRMYFPFGDKIKMVEEKLYEKDLILTYIN